MQYSGKFAKDPYMREEYLAYRYWSHLPEIIRGVDRGTLMSVYKVRDPRLLAIAPIRTQSEFAARFDIKDLGTLTDWNKRIQADGPPPIDRALRHVMIESLAALYVRVLAYGRPKDFKMFVAYVEGWTPGQKSPTEYKRTKIAWKTQRQLHIMLSMPRKDFLEKIEKMLSEDDL